jgi:uncharacterized cupin superfamily protein
MTIAHIDDVATEVRDVGDVRAAFRRVGLAAGATDVGVARIDVEPGCRAGPVHQHASEEEIFFVLEGSGLAWLDGAVHRIAAGDTIVYLAGGPEHTVIAGENGLSVLAYGENHAPPLVRLPRAGMIRRGRVWLDASGDDPLQREAAAGPLEAPAPTPRPRCIVALDAVELEIEEHEGYHARELGVAAAAGSVRSGLRHIVLEAGNWYCPPHWHGREKELFYVLEGEGTLALFDGRGQVVAEHELRPGHCVARPDAGPGPRLAHAIRAGERDMTYLAYGTRDPSEIVYYPRSRKAWLGPVLARIDLADDYWEGEG